MQLGSVQISLSGDSGISQMQSIQNNIQVEAINKNSRKITVLLDVIFTYCNLPNFFKNDNTVKVTTG